MPGSALVTLVEFLRGRLAEDQWVAEAASRGSEGWALCGDGSAIEETGSAWRMIVYDESGVDSPAPRMEESAHIVRWQPARVLADIAAKRAILDEFEAEERSANDRRRTGGHPGYAGPILRRCVLALAQSFADHPDFLPEWKA